jgi:hypothetical protein
MASNAEKPEQDPEPEKHDAGDAERTAHERQVEQQHEALAEESRRTHFVEHGHCW